VRRQVGRVVVAVVAAGAVAAGCSGPSQAGSAAIVGSEAVPLEVIQSQLDTALAKPDQVAQIGIEPAELARALVSQQVLHDLLEQQAEEARITVTDADIDAELTANGGADQVLESSLYDQATLRDRVRDNLLAAKLAERVVGDLSVTADLVAATSKEDAEQKAALLAQGGPAADALFANQNPANPTAARAQSYTALANPAEAGTVLFGVPVGSVVAFQPSPEQSTWIVFKVTDRQEGQVIVPGASAGLSQAQLVGIGQRLMQPVAEEVGVQVNPRYGVWDPIALRVVAADMQTGEVLAPGAAG
jgi:hypothetical protein